MYHVSLYLLRVQSYRQKSDVGALIAKVMSHNLWYKSCRIVERLSSRNQPDCSNNEKSTKFGTYVDRKFSEKIGYWAIRNFHFLDRWRPFSKMAA